MMLHQADGDDVGLGCCGRESRTTSLVEQSDVHRPYNPQLVQVHHLCCCWYGDGRMEVTIGVGKMMCWEEEECVEVYQDVEE